MRHGTRERGHKQRWAPGGAGCRASTAHRLCHTNRSNQQGARECRKAVGGGMAINKAASFGRSATAPRCKIEASSSPDAMTLITSAPRRICARVALSTSGTPSHSTWHTREHSTGGQRNEQGRLAVKARHPAHSRTPCAATGQETRTTQRTANDQAEQNTPNQPQRAMTHVRAGPLLPDVAHDVQGKVVQVAVAAGDRQSAAACQTIRPSAQKRHLGLSRLSIEVQR